MTEPIHRKWLARGPSGLSDDQLLAYLLAGAGAPGPATQLLATTLLERLGGLSRLPRAREGELSAIPGLGPHRSRRVLAVVELARRLAERPIPRGEACTNPDAVYRLLRGRLLHRRQESLWLLMLDCRSRRLALLELARGGRNSVSIAPSEVFEPAIREGASQLVLVHNHPSGDPEPSPEDRQLTERMQAAGELLGIRVRDHIIIGSNSYSSLAERGLLRQAPCGFVSPDGPPMLAELVPSDAGSRTRPCRQRTLDHALEEEETPWLFPEQLPLPFRTGLDLVWGNLAKGDTLAEEGPEPRPVGVSPRYPDCGLSDHGRSRRGRPPCAR